VISLSKTLYELIKTTTWYEVEDMLKEFYPDEDHVFFKLEYWKISNITPKETDYQIELDLQLFSEPNEEVSSEDFYYEVDEDQPYNLITDEMWSIYLNFSLSEKSLAEIPAEEILAHILFEILAGDIEQLMV